MLKKIVSTLEKEKSTKEELAEKLSIEPKKLTDSVLLAAVKYAGNSAFLGNLVEKTGRGVRRKDPKYIEKTGLLIQPWQFEGRGVVKGQRYSATSFSVWRIN